MDKMTLNLKRKITVIDIKDGRARIQLDDGQSWWIGKYDTLNLNLDYAIEIKPKTRVEQPAPAVEVRSLKKHRCDNEPCNGELMRKLFSNKWFCTVCKAEYE